MRSQLTILRRPVMGIATAMILLLAWLGQSAIVAVHTHNVGPAVVAACHESCSGSEAHSPPDLPADHDHKNDRGCSICVLAMLAASGVSMPGSAVAVDLAPQTRSVITKAAWIEPEYVILGLHQSRGPPALA